MRGDPYKMKIPSSKRLEKKQSKEHRERERQRNPDLNLKNASLEELRQRAEEMRKMCSKRQQQLLSAEKTTRIETFKNQNYKNEVSAFEKKSESVRIALAHRLIEQYKDNHDSPLFFNENGLSPFQMLMLHYSRNESQGQNICMICYLDIEPNNHIVQMPCSHILHRECAVQHLLYSRHCPGCSEEITFHHVQNKFLKK